MGVNSRGLDPNIIEVDDNPLIVVITIWDKLAKSWEYVDYPLSNKAFKMYLKMTWKNKRHNLKVQIESRKNTQKLAPLHTRET